MKPSIYEKRQSFEVHFNSVISFVFVTFCQPRILRYSACDVTDIFAKATPAENRVGNLFVSKGFDRLESSSANHTHD